MPARRVGPAIRPADEERTRSQAPPIRRYRSRSRARRRRASALIAGLLVVGALLLLLLSVDTRPADRFGELERLNFGRGARGATVVRPAQTDRPPPAVIFLHGWGQTERSDYRRWIEHLARRGNAVVVPRYQDSLRTPPDRVFKNALAGIQAALAEISIAPEPLVVAGHSAGGLLAADYAVAAASNPALPDARALFIVYPGGVIRGFSRPVPTPDPSALPPETHLVVLAGAKDRVVGEVPAAELIAGATQIPSDRRRLVRVADPTVDDHRAPEGAGPPARTAFWSRLDRLAAASRRP